MAGLPAGIGWPRLVLASASPRRRQLLEQLGVDLIIRRPDIDEDAGCAEDPIRTALLLARRKAQAVAATLAGPELKRLVVAADTVVCYRHHVLGKPTDDSDAARMLRLLSGRWHHVITGLCLLDPRTGRSARGHELTNVRFRALSPDEIRRYVQSGEPMDKAGAYGIQGLGALLVARVDGCYFNIVGLPLVRLNAMIGRMDR
jgi:septum formation protein